VPVPLNGEGEDRGPAAAIHVEGSWLMARVKEQIERAGWFN